MSSLSSRSRYLAGTALAGAFAVLPLANPVHAQEAAQQEKPGRILALDRLVISATKLKEAVIDALAGQSAVDKEELDRIQPDTAADIFRSVPGVAASMNGDDPATSINIRGMEQYGRVVVTLDGARQDYWRVGHGSGSFYVEPELLKEVTVIRGPVSNNYGSGGIGGVVAFETMAAGDFLNADERWAMSQRLGYETNGEGFTTSTIGALRISQNADIIGNIVYRDRDAYEDGNGATVPWTGETVLSGYGKATFRPTDDQEIKLGYIRQRYEDFVTGSSGSTNINLSRYDATTINDTYTGSYTYKPEDNKFIDFELTAYHNDTRADQAQVWPAASIGNSRFYEVKTTGFNARNASRFDAYGFANTLTYGVDYYHLEGSSDHNIFGEGTQDAYGAFLQWKGEYSTWLELIAAGRYDGFKLEGLLKDRSEASLSGGHFSPRLTAAIKPFEGFQFYGTYAEGYRAPMTQDVFRGGGSHGAVNSYVPNLLLEPETARTWELGINLKYNDIFTASDALRAKLNVFHTDVADYIDVDLTDPVRRAQNIGDARLRGIEAEGIYDFGWGFVNLSGALIEAEVTSGVYAGQALNNTPLDRFSGTLGFRVLDEQLTFGAQLLTVGKIIRTQRTNPNAAQDIASGFELVNLFADWKINDTS